LERGKKFIYLFSKKTKKMNNNSSKHQDEDFDDAIRQIEEYPIDDDLPQSSDIFGGNFDFDPIATSVVGGHNRNSSSSSSSRQQHRLHAMNLGRDNWQDFILNFHKSIVKYSVAGGDTQQQTLDIINHSIRSEIFVTTAWGLWKPTAQGESLTTSKDPCQAWMIDVFMFFTALMRTAFAGESDHQVPHLPLRHGVHGNQSTIIKMVQETPILLLGSLKVVPLHHVMFVTKGHPLISLNSWVRNPQSYEKIVQMASAFLTFRLLISLSKIIYNHRNNVFYKNLIKSLEYLNSLFSRNIFLEPKQNPSWGKKLSDLLSVCGTATEQLRINFLNLAALLYSEDQLKFYLADSIRASRACIVYLFIHRCCSQSLINFNPCTEDALDFVDKHNTTPNYPFCEQADLWVMEPDMLYWQAIHFITHNSGEDKFCANILQFSIMSIDETMQQLMFSFTKFMDNLADKATDAASIAKRVSTDGIANAANKRRNNNA
jgi:hypothetical protein